MIRDSKKLEGVLRSAYELSLLKQSFPGILGGAKAFEFVLVGGQSQVSIERFCSSRGLNTRCPATSTPEWQAPDWWSRSNA